MSETRVWSGGEPANRAVSIAVRQAFEAYLLSLVAGDPPEVARGKVEWRSSCYGSGLKFAAFVEELGCTPPARVLDVACAWGGHAAALGACGYRVVAADLLNHEFARFDRFCSTQPIDISVCLSDCEQLPFQSETFDVLLALELVEHIGSVSSFAAEVARLLRPGGMCLVSTPARWRSFIEGEPHFGLRGLTILPLRLQGQVARSLFGRKYPYPIARQYASARSVIAPFAAVGLSGQPILRGRIGSRLRSRPGLQALAARYFWDFVVLRKPADTTRRPAT